jgi:Nif-specific regulatory protein
MRMMQPARGARESRLAAVKRELRVARLLFRISRTLNAYLSIEDICRPVLQILADRAGISRGSILILDQQSGEIYVDLNYGFSDREKPKDCSGYVRRIAGEVIAVGTPAAIEKASNELRFLNEVPAGEGCGVMKSEDASYVCVPIKGGSGTLGVLCVDCLFPENLSLSEQIHLLTTIAALLGQAIEFRRRLREREHALEDEKERLRGEILDHFKPDDIIGNSHAIQRVCRLINQVAPSEARVFITGESGVGKELVARIIHLNSARAEKPFVKVHLAALPERTVESELFGHERGAFAGAGSLRRGCLEMADGGTLFLDEIGDLPMSTQVKLLRFLQEKAFERLGGVETIRSDVRIISSTNRNIDAAISQFRFRLDLFYRLSLFPIFVPPLRERKTDIPLLVHHFIERNSKKHGKVVGRISFPAMEAMMSYHWPGNVRELKNCVERAVTLNRDGVIHAHQLPIPLQTAETSRTPSKGKLQASLASLESEMLVDALKATRGDADRAAGLLGISARHMRMCMTRHRIRSRQFRRSNPSARI